MKFEIKNDTTGKKYIFLDDIQLGQELKAIYSKEDDTVLILDPDSKDYRGEEYNEKVKFDEKEYGVVQSIKAGPILAISELLKVIRTV